MKRGIIIAIEGIDFSGKTMLINSIRNIVSQQKNSFVSASDDSEIGKSISDILKKKVDQDSLSVLFSQSRHEVIRKALNDCFNGINVWFDRFVLSSIAYQHYGSGISLQKIISLHNSDCFGVFPDYTIFIRKSLRDFVNYRNNVRRFYGTDLMEESGDEFMQRVISGYEQEIISRRFTGKTIVFNNVDDAIFNMSQIISANKDIFGIN